MYFAGGYFQACSFLCFHFWNWRVSSSAPIGLRFLSYCSGVFPRVDGEGMYRYVSVESFFFAVEVLVDKHIQISNSKQTTRSVKSVKSQVQKKSLDRLSRVNPIQDKD